MEIIKLISMTSNALHTVVMAARECKDSFHLSDTPSIRDKQIDMFHTDKVGPKDIALVKKCMEEGHESILEHVNLVFEIDFSRVAHTQAVRHRLASFSAESARCVNQSKPKFFTPDTISKNTPLLPQPVSALQYYWDTIAKCVETYRGLISNYGLQPEDARYVLPMALMQPMVMSANLREWRHILRERTCKTAQFEIRRAMKQLRVSLRKIHEIFTYGSSKYDNCPEKETCGLCLVNWENIETLKIKEFE